MGDTSSPHYGAAELLPWDMLGGRLDLTFKLSPCPPLMSTLPPGTNTAIKNDTFYNAFPLWKEIIQICCSGVWSCHSDSSFMLRGTHKHARTHTHKHACTHARTHAYSCIHMHTHTHACTLRHTHSHKPTHTLKKVWDHAVTGVTLSCLIWQLLC